MIVPVALTMLLLVSARSSAEDSWVCRNGALERNVDVFYPSEPARLPCKVYYSKPQENVLPRVIWSAENTAGFCERKAREFVTKLHGLGWHCESSETAVQGD